MRPAVVCAHGNKLSEGLCCEGCSCQLLAPFFWDTKHDL